MKHIRPLLLLVLCCLSQILFSQGMSDWNGSFEGTIFGANATLAGKLNGDQWTGTIAVAGYPIQFEGTIIDMQCTGTMTDPQAKTSSPFTAKYSGKEITISIHDIDPISGHEENMNFVFFKTTDQQLVGSVISNSVTAVEKTNTIPRDQSLIGLWRYTDTYVSGDFSFASDYFIQFNANGDIMISEGRTAGGGPVSSLDSGDGDIHQGIWKTENKTLWIKDSNKDWQSYATYYLDGHSLMLTYSNGTKQVWEKI